MTQLRGLWFGPSLPKYPVQQTEPTGSGPARYWDLAGDLQEEKGHWAYTWGGTVSKMVKQNAAIRGVEESSFLQCAVRCSQLRRGGACRLREWKTVVAVVKNQSIFTYMCPGSPAPLAPHLPQQACQG